MWWSRRSFLSLSVFAAGLPLGGCFKPVLAEGGAASGLLGRVALPEIDGRFSYHMVKSLERQLGVSASPDFRLAIQTGIEERGLAVAQDNAVTRVTLTATARWTLFRNGDPDPVMTGDARSQSGFNATSSLFATRQLRRDIERRLARDLGERISRVILASADRLDA